MIIVVLSEDKDRGVAVSNEIQVLLESLKIGVTRGEGPDYDEPHEAILESMRGADVSLVFSQLPAKR